MISAHVFSILRNAATACVLAIVAWGGPAGPVAADDLPAKFKLDGNTLIYDTERPEDDEDQLAADGVIWEISDSDIDVFEAILGQDPTINRLQLNSGGGSVYAGERIAQLVVDHTLDTWVVGECVSACVDIFLAGEQRQMTLGSKIGFHQRDWSPSAVQSYYRRWRKDEQWATPFEFGSWIYRDTQAEIFRHLDYMISRDVDPVFAIRTLETAPENVWFPSRMRLVAAGVLRAAP
ncbi:hypothetical protein [Phaeobacter sp.]|uniref:COG3904 family protein n=1 Tax=Phaeobacter sp. TaxID=1902409 RepID=UPI0025E2C8C2|nr:hypothetical protein [Phaeobacter sp.]